MTEATCKSCLYLQKFNLCIRRFCIVNPDMKACSYHKPKHHHVVLSHGKLSPLEM